LVADVLIGLLVLVLINQGRKRFLVGLGLNDRSRIIVLAHNLVLALVNLADLQHGVLGVDALSLALFAQVVVFHLGARVANTLDGILATLIARVVRVDLVLSKHTTL